MNSGIYDIICNRKIAAGVFLMEIAGDFSDMRPGQFVNIKVDGLYLRRPVSVHFADNKHLSIIYKVVGKGTAKLSETASGRLDLLTGLGNGYDLSAAGRTPLLVGGGVGVPPLYYLASRLIGSADKITVITGFNTADEVFSQDEFRALGVDLILTTADGSEGIKGFVTDAMRGLKYSYVYACGPEPMLKAVYNVSETGGEFSFEERMGCGFGACMGCSCKTLYGYKRICKDGPVLKKEEIIWEK